MAAEEEFLCMLKMPEGSIEKQALKHYIDIYITLSKKSVSESCLSS